MHRVSGSVPVLYADGSTLVADWSHILQCWAEHFESVLNQPSVCARRYPTVGSGHASGLPSDHAGSR